MDESTVQVPVSLTARDLLAQIEATYDVSKLLAAARRQDGPPTAGDYAIIDALLSQPTPTAEHHDLCATRIPGMGIPGLEGVPQPCNCHLFLPEPPRIEDMAPGTRFVGRHVKPEECGGVDHSWFVIRSSRPPLVISDEGQHWSGDSIDPSTIRDVTPPAVTP
jgi:hypothetical protein